jgi:hypothetical protein
MPKVRDSSRFIGPYGDPEEDKTATAEASANMIEAGQDDA